MVLVVTLRPCAMDRVIQGTMDHTLLDPLRDIL